MYPKTKEIIFMYNTEYPSLDDGLLYHYTSAESFFKILESASLKSSDFSRLNDLNEGNLRNGDMTDACLDISVREALCKRGFLLCFTENYEQDGILSTGINHPRMWAQYADNNNGVCIAIHKAKFLDENAEILNGRFYMLKKVDYRSCLSFKFKKSNEAEDFLQKNWREILYVKHNDWKQENETRFFGLNLPDKFLSIENSVAFVCLSSAFLKNDDNMNRLIGNIVSPNSKFYHKLVPHSFAECLVDGLGYNPEDCATNILWRIRKNKAKYQQYLAWLNRKLNYKI